MEKERPISVVDEVEILKGFQADPKCKSCYGKGRLGINVITDKERKFAQLQLCHCVTPTISEYMRIETQITALAKAIMDAFSQTQKYVQEESAILVAMSGTLKQLSDRIERLTMVQEVHHKEMARYHLGYWIGRAVQKFRKKEEGKLL